MPETHTAELDCRGCHGHQRAIFTLGPGAGQHHEESPVLTQKLGPRLEATVSDQLQQRPAFVFPRMVHLDALPGPEVERLSSHPQSQVNVRTKVFAEPMHAGPHIGPGLEHERAVRLADADAA